MRMVRSDRAGGTLVGNGEGMTDSQPPIQTGVRGTVHVCGHCKAFLLEVEQTDVNWAGLRCDNPECSTFSGAYAASDNSQPPVQTEQSDVPVRAFFDDVFVYWAETADRDGTSHRYIAMELRSGLQRFRCDVRPDRRGLRHCENVAKRLGLLLIITDDARAELNAHE